MNKLTMVAALALALAWVNPGSTVAAERTFTATPNADGSYTLREARTGASWGWSGTLPGGRAYRVLAEPNAGSRLAYVAFEDGTTAWVPAEAVCGDADLLLRLSDACR